MIKAVKIGRSEGRYERLNNFFWSKLEHLLKKGMRGENIFIVENHLPLIFFKKASYFFMTIMFL